MTDRGARAGGRGTTPAPGAGTPTGISIHVAVNDCAASRASGYPALEGCLADAQAMQDLAAAAGFEPRLITGAAATGEPVVEAIRGAGPRVGANGLLLLTFSGHGARIRDRSTLSGWRYGWSLHDRVLMNDELAHAWAEFPAGARVLVLSDSCFSGELFRGVRGAARPSTDAAGGDAAPAPRASVWLLFLSAAEDNEGAADGTPHGAFTQALLDVWDRGAFEGDYVELHAEIYRRLMLLQHPVIRAWPSPGFARQRPFTI